MNATSEIHFCCVHFTHMTVAVKAVIVNQRDQLTVVQLTGHSSAYYE